MTVQVFLARRKCMHPLPQHAQDHLLVTGLTARPGQPTRHLHTCDGRLRTNPLVFHHPPPLKSPVRVPTRTPAGGRNLARWMPSAAHPATSIPHAAMAQAA